MRLANVTRSLIDVLSREIESTFVGVSSWTWPSNAHVFGGNFAVTLAEGSLEIRVIGLPWTSNTCSNLVSSS